MDSKTCNNCYGNEKLFIILENRYSLLKKDLHIFVFVCETYICIIFRWMDIHHVHICWAYKKLIFGTLLTVAFPRYHGVYSKASTALATFRSTQFAEGNFKCKMLQRVKRPVEITTSLFFLFNVRSLSMAPSTVYLMNEIEITS